MQRPLPHWNWSGAHGGLSVGRKDNISCETTNSPPLYFYFGAILLCFGSSKLQIISSSLSLHSAQWYGWCSLIEKHSSYIKKRSYHQALWTILRNHVMISENRHSCWVLHTAVIQFHHIRQKREHAMADMLSHSHQTMEVSHMHVLGGVNCPLFLFPVHWSFISQH